MFDVEEMCVCVCVCGLVFETIGVNRKAKHTGSFSRRRSVDKVGITGKSVAFKETPTTSHLSYELSTSLVHTIHSKSSFRT